MLFITQAALYRGSRLHGSFPRLGLPQRFPDKLHEPFQRSIPIGALAAVPLRYDPQNAVLCDSCLEAFHNEIFLPF